jgi:hypothetical protein
VHELGVLNLEKVITTMTIEVKENFALRIGLESFGLREELGVATSKKV